MTPAPSPNTSISNTLNLTALGPTTIPPAVLTEQSTSLPAPQTAPDIHLPEQSRLLREIIHMMVGIDVEPASCVWPPAGEDLVEAIVRFNGPWSGAMIFESTLPLSYEFTARFMTVPLPSAMDDDVRDAHGDLANMIAGNFKALLPAGSHLSIPEVRLRSHSGATEYVPDPVMSCCLCQSVFHTMYGECSLTLADCNRIA